MNFEINFSGDPPNTLENFPLFDLRFTEVGKKWGRDFVWSGIILEAAIFTPSRRDETRDETREEPNCRFARRTVL